MKKLHIRRPIRLFHAASLGLCLLLASGSVCAQTPSSGRWVLRSGKQADKWQDAFVTGNGTHGMMVMGNSLSERITHVHEELFLRAWDRSIVGVPNIAQHLSAQRQHIANGNDNNAFFVYGDAINQANAAGAGATWELTPHPAFDLNLIHLSPGGLLSYANELDLESGEASCRWQRANAAVEQRVFSSRIANVNVVSLKATSGKKLNLTLSLAETPGRSGMHLDTFDLSAAFNSVTTGSEPGWLSYRAKYALDSGGYEGLARITNVGGSMVKSGNALTITDADELLVLIRITPLADGNSTVETAVKTELAAMPTNYAQLLQPHAVKHSEMFGRVKLDLGAASEWQTETTQQMLQNVAANGANAHYLEAVHAMGRYLLISSCGKYPPPLRGIWGGDWKADWAGGFVLDSNLDLAMAAAGPGNLPECIESYAGYIERQLPGWRLNATNTLGVRGFVAASFANPETGYQTHKNPAHWYYICQAGWHLRPLYDYTLLSKNDAFMQNRVLPLYLEMADFYQDYMVADANGVLHITPGCSPESNTPQPYNTQIAGDCTIDLAVAREVYQVLIEQGPKFGILPAQITEWINIRNKIAPYRIDSRGTLAEWAPQKYVVTNYGARHNSHLYPIFPGHEFFQPGSSAGLLEAARVALQKRIETEHLRLYDELSGHGIMYAAMMSSRLREVKNVHKLLNHIAKNGFHYDSMFTSHCPNRRYYNMDVGGSLPRLLMEMLVFSHPGNIDLMPGWNADLPAGSCNGILVRGGHKINIAWAGSAMTSAVLHAGANETLTVRFREHSASLTVQSGQQYELKNLFPETILLNDVGARRVTDSDRNTGTGDNNQLDVLDVGNYDFNDRTRPVFVFQMIGKKPSHTVTTADFSVTQTLPANTPTFDVEAHVIRTSATPTILNSDFENTAQLLMTNFDNNNQNGGTVSLNSAAETTLGSYLNTNWVEGNYVFIALKNTAYTAAKQFELLRYGNSSPSWTAPSTDAQLNITTEGPTASGFSAWITGTTFANGPVPALQQGPDADPDNDAMSNLVEYALNGDPTISDSMILPDLVVTATDFEFTYSRLDLSLADTVQTFEYGSDLAGWTPIVIPAGPGVINVGIATITVTDTGSTDSVKISIPRSVDVGEKLFGHLKVVK